MSFAIVFLVTGNNFHDDTQSIHCTGQSQTTLA